MNAGTEPSARQILARHIRWRRFLLGWSQEYLAEASGMHRTYISTLERGRCNPGLDALERLAHAFQIPVTELLGSPPERTPPATPGQP